MKKILRKLGKYGNSWVIKLKPQDVKDLDAQIGDDIDLTNIVIIKRRIKQNG